MASAQVIETSVTNNSPSQDSNHPDDLFQSKYVTPRFKPFSCLYNTIHRSVSAYHNPHKGKHAGDTVYMVTVTTTVGRTQTNSAVVKPDTKNR